MKYVLTAHARQRMKERNIFNAQIEEALFKPTKIEKNNQGQFLIRKVYEQRGCIRLLLLVVRKENDTWKIITVIDTSKVQKYL